MCLLHEPKLYCLACAESRVGCQWDRVVFSDTSAFSSANNGFVDCGENLNSQYAWNSMHNSYVTIGDEGPGKLHCRRNPDDLQYIHI